ncbi:MAG: YggS family pyridoxal phosphate-dependent enzyme [Mycobacteriales bacterium]
MTGSPPVPPAPVASEDPRRVEIADRLHDVSSRIAAATARAGRPAGSVTLIAVTKTFGLDDVRRLADLGVADVGESRDQEAAAKAAELPALRWHFVGRLQRNKARSVAAYAACVHSIDRAALADALGAAAGRVRRTVDVCLQVSLDGDPQRGGAPVEALGGLADSVARCGGLRLAGLMAVPPLSWDPDRAYAELARAAGDLRHDHPDAIMLSAGMTADFEQAIVHGATHVRVGTALLGGRPPIVG